MSATSVDHLYFHVSCHSFRPLSLNYITLTQAHFTFVCTIINHWDLTMLMMIESQTKLNLWNRTLLNSCQLENSYPAWFYLQVHIQALLKERLFLHHPFRLFMTTLEWRKLSTVSAPKKANLTWYFYIVVLLQPRQHPNNPFLHLWHCNWIFPLM